MNSISSNRERKASERVFPQSEMGPYLHLAFPDHTLHRLRAIENLRSGGHLMAATLMLIPVKNPSSQPFCSFQDGGQYRDR
ncbi:hypothetical protein OK016_12930 [Vibrio chagasii]|nr:hypothetical protein [Vibrio chagasii]